MSFNDSSEPTASHMQPSVMGHVNAGAPMARCSSRRTPILWVVMVHKTPRVVRLAHDWRQRVSPHLCRSQVIRGVITFRAVRVERIEPLGCTLPLNTLLAINFRRRQMVILLHRNNFVESSNYFDTQITIIYIRAIFLI